MRLELLNSRGQVVAGLNDIGSRTRGEIWRFVLKTYAAWHRRGRPEKPAPDEAWMN